MTEMIYYKPIQIGGVMVLNISPRATEINS